MFDARGSAFFPVGLPGAGFYVGDCHAARGDGELCGGGIEVRPEVTLTLTVRPGNPPDMTWRRVETADALVVVAASCLLGPSLPLVGLTRSGD